MLQDRICILNAFYLNLSEIIPEVDFIQNQSIIIIIDALLLSYLPMEDII